MGRREMRNPIKEYLKMPVGQFGIAADLLNPQQVIPQSSEGPVDGGQRGTQDMPGVRGTNRNTDLIDELVKVFIAQRVAHEEKVFRDQQCLDDAKQSTSLSRQTHVVRASQDNVVVTIELIQRAVKLQ